ncbi:MAG: hypothetical protein JXI33_03455 [Candidatus Aminicenantes bacterium]|nr:hypothetical protein [Candidatus Aminicenantes bacterium]
MKKTMILLCGMLLVSGLYSSANKMTIDINVGAITDQNLTFPPDLWSAGAELDIPLGKVLMLSPEAIFYGYKFEFKDFLFCPAVILNVTFSNFFAGGGVTKFFYLGSGTFTPLSDDFFMKVNAGLMSESLKITLYVITPFSDQAFKDFAVGLTLGFRL